MDKIIANVVGAHDCTRNQIVCGRNHAPIRNLNQFIPLNYNLSNLKYIF